MLMGEYHHNLDEKNRLIIPSKLREEMGDLFVLTRGLDECLFIYPREEWNRIIEKYKELPNTKDARNFMRFFLAGATECSFDKQGRISISSPLMRYAELEHECVIIGVNDHLEVWSEDRWEDFMNTNEREFSDIADNLFSPNIN
ncbi:MAG: division/cell wall cluster transcriptional repressor MraZ [Bacilli bacterium]|nr:division/cell wall cluster transcriptional repressor MraZ [Bacilli bacterium]